VCGLICLLFHGVRRDREVVTAVETLLSKGTFFDIEGSSTAQWLTAWDTVFTRLLGIAIVR
jgi:hypothetical protein